MIGRAANSIKNLPQRRLYHASRQSRRYASPNRNVNLIGTTGAAALTAAGALWYSLGTVHNDTAESLSEKGLRKDVLPGIHLDVVDGALTSTAWGSNKTKTIDPETPELESIRTPSSAKWLDGVALRDLILHESHAACIDARGDVYQWGDGFFGPSSSEGKGRKPVATLRGKNIVQFQATSNRLFALSSSGRLYVLSTQASALQSTFPSSSASSWTSWIWGDGQTTGHSEITPDEKLGRGEKFVSISAGNDHLLGLTSKGRVFAHPINKNANAYGQLGLRKFSIPSHADNTRMDVELIPLSVLDPYAKVSVAARRPSASSEESSPPPVAYSLNLIDVDDEKIGFCDRLFEVSALKGIEVDQIAAGGRSSFVKTPSGRVLGWGANEYGQIGLGVNVTVDTITRPTEVILWRAVPREVISKCLNVTAGGDLTFFTVERTDGSSLQTVDVLGCGNGQWGGLGNALFRNSQNEPLRAKAVSGLLEYSEKHQNLQPIVPHGISVSPTGHVLLTLDTQVHSGPGVGGRDLYAWGANYEYQLGNGRRTSLASPTSLQRPEGGRYMLMKTKADVKDMEGKVWKKGVEVEQTAVAGFGNSVVYWKLC